MVSSEYTMARMVSIVPTSAMMMVLTGMRKATRPAKKNRREACRRRGIISTTVCILNRLRP